MMLPRGDKNSTTKPVILIMSRKGHLEGERNAPSNLLATHDSNIMTSLEMPFAHLET